MHGTTNALVALGDAATAGGEWRPALDVLRQRHRDTAQALLERPEALLSKIDALCDELAELLHATSLLRQPGRTALERIHGMGEVLSTSLLHAHLVERGGDYALLDARNVLVVRHTDLGAVVDWEASAGNLADWRARHPQARATITGFVARDALVSHDGSAALVLGNGAIAVLKRHGARVAVRRLVPPLWRRDIPEGVTIETGEKMFGPVTLIGVFPDDVARMEAMLGFVRH